MQKNKGHVFVFRQLNSGNPGREEAGLTLAARFSGRGTCNRGGHAGGSVLTMFWIITRTTQRMTGKRIHDMFCLHWKRVFARAPQLAVLHFQSRWSSS
ncbi:hypothetical protein ZOSMA_31G00510 [Zostera marina]|uniref:Uncharacterized protein n=1 Tax=Zostera marina TaxID=29655 RepID=A0A0K9P8Y2_ZOSMR|nr:hypothetical protein ZOSMA_31G00510 [Zostera marina]